MATTPSSHSSHDSIESSLKGSKQMAFDYESKIAALLERAERETTQEARDGFNAKAQELMLKKGISEAQARAAKGEVHAKVEPIVIRTVDFDTRYARGHMVIAHSITANFGGLRGYYVQKHNSERNTWFVVGYESDVVMALSLIHSVVAQAETERVKWWRGSLEKRMGFKGRDAWKMQRNFLMAYGPAVGVKVRDTYNRVVREAETATPGTELMLRDKDKEVQDWMDSHSGRMRKGKGFSVGSSGYGAGREAGSRANVGRSVGQNRGIES